METHIFFVTSIAGRFDARLQKFENFLIGCFGFSFQCSEAGSNTGAALCATKPYATIATISGTGAEKRLEQSCIIPETSSDGKAGLQAAVPPRRKVGGRTF